MKLTQTNPANANSAALAQMATLVANASFFINNSAAEAIRGNRISRLRTGKPI